MSEGEGRMSVELREMIEEISFILRHWATDRLTDKTRKSFLSTLAEQADQLGISLTVEHLLPGLQGVLLENDLFE